MLPPLLEEIIENLYIYLDGEREKDAILNVFLPKFCSVIASKQINTLSINHKYGEIPLQYYALNLLPSGYGKNVIRNVVNNMFTWHSEYCKIANERHKKCEETAIDTKYKPTQQKEKEKEYAKIMTYTPELNNANSQLIYDLAKWTVTNNFGSLYFYNTEFAKMFTQNNDFNDVLEMSLNASDGEIDYTSVLTNQRKTLDKRVSMSIYYATAYNQLLDYENREKFIKEGNDGVFRRFFIYFLNNKIEHKNIPLEEVEIAKSRIDLLSKKLNNIYDLTPENHTMRFSNKANLVIKDYEKMVKEKIDNELSYSDPLMPIDESYKIHFAGSTWKIIKLSFLLQFFTDNFLSEVSDDVVLMSIEYFKNFDKYFIDFLNKKPITYRNIVKAYIIKNLNKTLSKNKILSDLREMIFYNLSYEDWEKLRTNLIKYIIEDLENDSIYRQELDNDNYIFYRK